MRRRLVAYGILESNKAKPRKRIQDKSASGIKGSDVPKGFSGPVVMEILHIMDELRPLLHVLFAYSGAELAQVLVTHRIYAGAHVLQGPPACGGRWDDGVVKQGGVEVQAFPSI